MLSQAIETFEKMYKENGEALITDSYIPADGEYIIIDEVDNELKEIGRVPVKIDKKTRTIDRTYQYFDFLSKADYMSQLISTDKPIDGKKKIQSNNYLSFIVKKESIALHLRNQETEKIKPEDKKKELTIEMIDNYYDILEDPLKKYTKNKKEARNLYMSIEDKNGKVNIERLNRIRDWIKNNVFSLVSKDSTDKGYLKIFFYCDLEEYKKESEKYFIPNIFNKTDFNVEIEGITYGLPDNNMGLNDKKPYLKNMTRKTKVPYLINKDEVLLQKSFFDYLMNQALIGKLNVYIDNKKIKLCKNGELLDSDFTGIYFRLQRGKELEIHDMDTVTGYKAKVKPLYFENVLDIDINKLKQKYEVINRLEGIQRLVNEVFFSKMLVSNYFAEAKDIKITDTNLKRNILLARNSLFTWFYKGSSATVWKSLDAISLSLTKGAILNEYFIVAIERFNLRTSLKTYFEGGEKMADIIESVKSGLREKISKEETLSISSDREYFFAVGQITKFFIDKGKGKKKPQSLINPIINAKNDERLKEQLSRLYKKYNYDIESGRRFNNMFAMIKSYEPEGKIDEDLIIAGYLHSGLIYEKSKKDGAE